MIQRHVISTNPPLAHYRDTVTGRTWFDHAVFDAALADLKEPTPPTSSYAEAIRSYIDTSRLLLTGENPRDLEAILAEYHDHVLRALEDGDTSWQ